MKGADQRPSKSHMKHMEGYAHRLLIAVRQANFAFYSSHSYVVMPVLITL